MNFINMFFEGIGLVVGKLENEEGVVFEDKEAKKVLFGCVE